MTGNKKGRFVRGWAAVIALCGALAAVIVFSVIPRSQEIFHGEYQDMSGLITEGKPLPEGAFGRIPVRLIAGAYVRQTGYDIGARSYYLAILPDMTYLTIRTGEKESIKRLNELSILNNSDADLWHALATATGTYEFTGKIQKLPSSVKGYCDEIVEKWGIAPEKMRYAYLDADAAPPRNLAPLVPPALLALLIAAAVTVTIKREANQQAETPVSTDRQTNTQTEAVK